MTSTTDNDGRISRRIALASLAAGVATLAGCGGGAGSDGAAGGDAASSGAAPDFGTTGAGVDTAGISSGGTGSFTTGTVSGLGSILVCGIRFDDASATVERDDGGVVGPVRPGMVVAVNGTSVAAGTAGALATATALQIRYASEWAGPVDAVDAVARTLTLAGQRADIAANAVFEGDALQLAAITTSHHVELYGFLDLSTGRLLATRVEVSSTTAGDLRLSGQVANLDPAARTFQLGTAQIGFDAGLALPAGWANGELVRVTLAPTRSGGLWSATGIQQRQAWLPAMAIGNDAEAELEGPITSITGPGRFTVNGIAVDASGVTLAAALLVGAVVEVHGTTFDGTVVATRVEIKPLAQVEAAVFEFLGTVSNLDILTRTFTLKGLQFTYGLATPIDILGWLTGATPSVRVEAMPAGADWIATGIRQP